MSMEDAAALRSAARRSAFANAPMGVALTTPGGVLVDANPALCVMLGRTERELHGRSVLALVHPDLASSPPRAPRPGRAPAGGPRAAGGAGGRGARRRPPRGGLPGGVAPRGGGGGP